MISLYVVGDLEIACYTDSTGDIINGHNILLQCVANQIVAYSCSINNQSFRPCKCHLIITYIVVKCNTYRCKSLCN